MFNSFKALIAFYSHVSQRQHHIGNDVIIKLVEDRQPRVSSADGPSALER